MVGIFFGLIGSLVLIFESRHWPLSSALFSLIYISLGIVGFYFYARLVYSHQMAEEGLRSACLEDLNAEIRAKVIKRLRCLSWLIDVSEDTRGRYKLWFAWVGGAAYIALIVIGLIAVWLVN